mmetsp:Transcript_50111/g.100897  ORF Transcript_50111/g.100897 Transcript_50111/m.100897 type:complete len:322 (-) Transcript_50111:84-1049(-)
MLSRRPSCRLPWWGPSCTLPWRVAAWTVALWATGRRRVACSLSASQGLGAGFLHPRIVRAASSTSRRAQEGPDAPQLEDLPPLPQAASERLARLEGALERAHGPWSEPWEVRSAELEGLFRPSDSSAAYGELDRGCVGRLLCAAGLRPDDAFVDVGSGLGKLVAVAAALTRVGTAWGVELSPWRHAQALRGLERLREVGDLDSAEHARVHFVQGDCAERLPEELLEATHFMLTMRRSHKSAKQLRNALRDSPSASGRPRTIWCVGHNLPLCAGLKYTRRFQVPGFYKPPQQGPRMVIEGGHTKGFVVHEYQLAPSAGERSL